MSVRGGLLMSFLLMFSSRANTDPRLVALCTVFTTMAIAGGYIALKDKKKENYWYQEIAGTTFSLAGIWGIVASKDIIHWWDKPNTPTWAGAFHG